MEETILKLIYINCAGGGTSSLFCSKIDSFAKSVDRKICYEWLGDIIDIIKKNDDSKYKYYEYVLLYGGTQVILTRADFPLEIFDLIWICPQTRYFYNDVKSKCDKYKVPCENIDMLTFGRMNGDKALEYLDNFFSN